MGRLPNGQWGLCTPTAGAANTGVPVGSTATLRINEWLASPASPFVDDFIELYSPDARPVNLGGLFLTDQPIGKPFRHRIAPLSFIDGFGYRVFIADGNPNAGPDHVDFSLSQKGGEIGLVDEVGLREAAPGEADGNRLLDGGAADNDRVLAEAGLFLRFDRRTLAIK